MSEFHGTVFLKEFARDLGGSQYVGFRGRVSILGDREVVGFRVSGTESNWIARIEGPTQTYNFLGCEVRYVATHDESLDTCRDVLAVP